MKRKFSRKFSLENFQVFLKNFQKMAWKFSSFSVFWKRVFSFQPFSTIFNDTNEECENFQKTFSENIFKHFHENFLKIFQKFFKNFLKTFSVLGNVISENFQENIFRKCIFKGGQVVKWKNWKNIFRKFSRKFSWKRKNSANFLMTLYTWGTHVNFSFLKKFILQVLKTFENFPDSAFCFPGQEMCLVFNFENVFSCTFKV